MLKMVIKMVLNSKFKIKINIFIKTELLFDCNYYNYSFKTDIKT